MKTLYVVYREDNGALKHSIVEIEGKINPISILKELKRIKYHEDETEVWKIDFYEPTIISWQEIEEFTEEELTDFTKEDGTNEYLFWWMN